MKVGLNVNANECIPRFYAEYSRTRAGKTKENMILMAMFRVIYITDNETANLQKRKRGIKNDYLAVFVLTPP